MCERCARCKTKRPLERSGPPKKGIVPCSGGTFFGICSQFSQKSVRLLIRCIIKVQQTIIARSAFPKSIFIVTAMSKNNAARKRKERTGKTRPSSPASEVEVQMAQPPRNPTAHKTLLEIAADRELLRRNPGDSSTSYDSTIVTSINPDGTLNDVVEPSNASSSVANKYLDVLFYSLTLNCLHFTLTLLVHHQYGSDPPLLVPLFFSTCVYSATPTLLSLLILLLHPRASHPAVQVLFALISIIAGGWLVYATNDEPYLAVMAKAPALGTLWVWGIIEMKWEWAMCCLGVVGGWGWWKGYSII